MRACVRVRAPSRLQVDVCRTKNPDLGDRPIFATKSPSPFFSCCFHFYSFVVGHTRRGLKLQLRGLTAPTAPYSLCFGSSALWKLVFCIVSKPTAASVLPVTAVAASSAANDEAADAGGDVVLGLPAKDMNYYETDQFDADMRRHMTVASLSRPMICDIREERLASRGALAMRGKVFKDLYIWPPPHAS